jgi:hypothetical protein
MINSTQGMAGYRRFPHFPYKAKQGYAPVMESWGA